MSPPKVESGPVTFESVERGIAALHDKKRMGDAFEHVVARFRRHDPTVGFEPVWPWDD